MKKKLLFLLVGGLFLLGGCGKATESDIIMQNIERIFLIIGPIHSC